MKCLYFLVIHTQSEVSAKYTQLSLDLYINIFPQQSPQFSQRIGIYAKEKSSDALL